MGYHLLTISLFSLYFSAFFFPSFSELCHPSDKKALFRIKNYLNNPYHLASWDFTTDCCSWYCLKCDRTTHRIISLTIFAGNISGQIPPAVGDLPYLETLLFHKLTNLTGTIPPTIVKLKNLKDLTLSWTDLSGPIPEFLGKLKNLQFMDLSFNKFTGSIPPSLSQLPHIDFIRIDRNKLTGPIPDSLGYFRKKKMSLYLSHNQLSGKIPTSLSNMDFDTVEFARNKLEGDASMLFGRNKSTKIVDLSRNLLQFDISKVEFPKTITWLDISHNKISGNLPAELTALDLQLMNVSYNRLCGKIPVGGGLQRLDVYSYFHNKCLCGAPLGSCK